MNPVDIDTELRERRTHARAQTQQADAKATALAGAVVPAIAAAIAAGALIGLPPAAAVVGWVSAALGLAVVGTLGTVLWPRHTEPGATTAADLLDHLADTDMHAATAAEVVALDAIVTTKYRLLRRALATAASASLLAATTVVLTLTH